MSWRNDQEGTMMLINGYIKHQQNTQTSRISYHIPSDINHLIYSFIQKDIYMQMPFYAGKCETSSFQWVRKSDSNHSRFCGSCYLPGCWNNHCAAYVEKMKSCNDCKRMCHNTNCLIDNICEVCHQETYLGMCGGC